MKLGALSTLGALSLILGWALGQAGVEVVVPRDDNQITIRNLDESIDAKTYLNNKNCKEGIQTSIFYGPKAGFVNTLSEDAKLTSSVVIIETPEGEGEERERVELFNADLTFNRPRCPEEITRKPEEKVRLEQGRTTVTGESFVLEPEEDIGSMRGPVTLERVAEGDSPSLSAKSDELNYDFDSETSVLRGNVEVTSEDRISQAEELEYDEENSVAIMTGSPATSQDAEGTVQGEMIVYYLDSNDVVVKGDISAEIEIDLGEGFGATGLGSTGSSGGGSSPTPTPDVGEPTIPDAQEEQTGPQTQPEDPTPSDGCDEKFSTEAC